MPEQTIPPKQKITYKYIGKKESLTDIIKKVFPKEMIPTKTLGTVFGILFLVIVIVGLATFPFGKLLAGQTDVAIKVGFPWTFLIFDLEDPEGTPLKIGGLILDLLLYIIVAYMIDIAINIFFRGSLFKKGSKRKFPQQYKFEKKKNLVEKATEKTVQRIETKKL